ncbi:MAG: hypothetical protein JWO80_4687, partial [Bryobacterales bacterium]|nr:hypothetical protein [Bryobacterales bacterium]
GEGLHIRATNAQFDLVTSTGNTQFIGLRMDGGWDGKTSGLSGDTVSLQAVAPAHPYVINFHNCQFVNNKSRGVYIERGGYTSFTGNNIILGCGLHAVECFGLRTDACTTITTAGTCQWGACPNGYSIKLTECAKCTFRDVISEDTQGYQLNGLDNRAITFDGCYQENFHGENPTGLFLNDNSSAGIGLVVRSCFGGNLALPFFANWQDVYISGNSNLAESAVPFANRIVQADSGQKETAAHGGVSVTVTSVSLPPGTWEIDGTLQTADAGSCVLRDASFVLTTDLTKTGAASGTSAGFEIGTARVPNVPATPATRLNASKVYQNTTSGHVTLYMRAFLNASAGILAYRGVITAKRFN